jgi:uncharacterized protein YjbI with pentapeptide repeats
VKLVITGGDCVGQQAAKVLFEQTHWQRVNVARTQLDGVRLVDTRLETVDCSGAIWRQARLRRVEFVECKLLGTQLLGAQFEHVLMRDCKLEGAVLAATKCKVVRFERCDLRGVSFEEADLTGVVFQQCDLSEADLRGSKLNGADLRGSILNRVQVGAKELHGAIIDPTQAVQVVSLLGLTVKELDT